MFCNLRVEPLGQLVRGLNQQELTICIDNSDPYLRMILAYLT